MERIRIEERQHPLARAPLAAITLFGVGSLVLGVDLLADGPVAALRRRGLASRFRFRAVRLLDAHRRLPAVQCRSRQASLR